MIKRFAIVLIFTCCLIENIYGHDPFNPDTVYIQSGKLKLAALLWHPIGSGSFPALIFCHGNYATKSNPGTIDSLFGVVKSTAILGPVFAKHGYIFFALFRRGVGLSAGQGKTSQDRLLQTISEKGLEERNRLQIKLLETEQMDDIVSGLTYLRKIKDVDTNRIGVVGHSFGGSLALLLVDRNHNLKTVVDFAGAANSWKRSPKLRKLLTETVSHLSVPVMFIQTKNDYSTAPSDSLSIVMDRLNKSYLKKIYPPFGNTNDTGHNFIFLGIEIWESDVFKFLDETLKY